jgi:hypothetical protein
VSTLPKLEGHAMYHMMAYGYSVLSEINPGPRSCVPSISLFRLETDTGGLCHITDKEISNGGNDNMFSIKIQKQNKRDILSP